MQVNPAQFETLVAQAVDSLPEWMRDHLNNVAIAAAPLPSRHQLERARLGPGRMLLGLYEGVPLPKRGRGYHLAAPDRITLFHLPIQSQVRTPEQLVALIRKTIIHEIGHHFGFDEVQLRELDI